MNDIKLTKKCGYCKEEKDISNFGKSNQTLDGLRWECYDCRKQKYYNNIEHERILKRQDYYKHKEKRINYAKQKYLENKENFINKSYNYYHLNKEKVLASQSEYRKQNKEDIKRRKKEYYDRKRAEKLTTELEFKKSLITVEYPPDYKVCTKCRTLKHENEYNFKKGKTTKGIKRRSFCKECEKIENNKYKNKNYLTLLNKERQKRKENPEHYRRKNKKHRQSRAYKERINSPKNRIIRNATQTIRDILADYGLKKNGKATMKYIQCSKTFFWNYLESQFAPKMSFNNYGNKINNWSIDHYIPKEAFDILIKEEQDLCFHWSNCSPMWHLENETKQDKMPDGRLARDTKDEYSLIDKKRMILSSLLSKNLPHVTEDLLKKEEIYKDIINEFFPPKINLIS